MKPENSATALANQSLGKVSSEIAITNQTKPITEIAGYLGLGQTDLEPYGHYFAKLSLATMNSLISKTENAGRERTSKLILVTAISPTKSGEGKTTVSIGMAQSMWAQGHKALAVIREPSLGPVFGMKGGATGGGKCKVVPADDINLHFTGDLHAIAAANNLLAACIDNHIYQKNDRRLDPERIYFKRALDVNDRSLRQIKTGLGGKANGIERDTGFNITAASEIMACLCLSSSIGALKSNLGRIVVGLDLDGAPVSAGDLGVAGALTALLRHAIKPNLAQTIEGSPALIHGGPFANIAHGCSSIASIKSALALADYVITEAGFGSDLGFEKYCDILASREEALIPDAVAIVTTVKALKEHAGIKESSLHEKNAEAVLSGFENLDNHAKIVQRTGLPFLVIINRFDTDCEEELEIILETCKKRGWPVALCESFARGSEGSSDLSEKIVETAMQQNRFEPFYKSDASIIEKLEQLSRKIYGLDEVELTKEAEARLQWLEHHGFAKLPVCVAKSQYSLSGQKQTEKKESGQKSLKVRDFALSAGAGFVVALTGSIMTMPGLPRQASYLDIDIDENGNITGLG